ncbi:hypothetical protein ACO2Q9_20305 [Variovorax sp. VNK109]|uniref:hypothetical protein n=1 Tax=Variovorax sp. VNK109 TaxID=3400919 RepID=UPI003C129B16
MTDPFPEPAEADPRPMTPEERAARKAEVVDAIQRQRTRWIVRRNEALVAQRMQEQGLAEDGTPLDPDAFPRSHIMRVLTRQPLAVAGAVGLLIFLGPRRVLRAASWLLPLVLRRF